nr:hypothetical protein [Tanacetum cinerariifolium]
MVAYLSKSNASEGFNQIIDFLNGSSIKYALTVNPNIYVSCIKQFWTTVAVKKVNDVIRLQALVDKKKVVSWKLLFKKLSRVGKGFSRVETPLFKGMLVEQQVAEEGDGDENDENVNASDADEGDRVKKLERRNKVKVLKLRRLQKVRTSQRVETPNETVMDDESNHERMIAKMDQDVDVVLKDDKKDDKEVADAVKEVHVEESAQDQGRTAESQAEIYKIDLDHANKVLSMQEDKTEPTKVQEEVDVVTTAKQIIKVTAAPSRRRKRVVIRDLQEESIPSTIIPVETKSKDKELHAEQNKNIDWDKAIDHVKKKAKEDPVVKRYQVLKRKPQTEAQARKNIMTKEQIKEDENRALKRLNETLAERAAKR